NEVLLQLAGVILDGANEGAAESIVFESPGLPYRTEPRRGLEAVRDALRQSHRQLSIRDTGSSGAGTRGLARLIEFTGADRARPEPAAPGAIAAPATGRPAGPLPPAVLIAMQHAATFALHAATLLADEHYVQEVKTRPSAGSLASMSRNSLAGITIERRVLDSEVALIHVIEGELWLLARDVQKVDAKPLADSLRVPLPSVHANSTPEAIQQFRQIARQGARFNIGGIQRDINVPTLALWLLTPDISPRLAFTEAGRETVAGARCDVIRFKEKGAPYLFNAEGEPKPVAGRFWIDRARAAVVRTELILEGRQGQYSSSRALLTVDYAFDQTLAAWVPKTMTERYDPSSQATFVTGVMTYTNYRQFTTGARIVK
ncbi:MAG: hypothetical protein ABI665_10475, partial [Vicinamibacterales bacterium]